VCLATVYLEDDSRRETVMQDVAWIVSEGSRLELIPFLGESRLLFQAKIKSIDLVNSTIILERMAAEPPPVGFDGQRN
jgi:predicted RNA-binding protein